jgi:hypothetical protein
MNAMSWSLVPVGTQVVTHVATPCAPSELLPPREAVGVVAQPAKARQR